MIKNFCISILEWKSAILLELIKTCECYLRCAVALTCCDCCLVFNEKQ